MDYPLENLDPERFQQVCQALLTKEHPDFQCFPVGQPDGGRDAVSYSFSGQRGKFIVFQVKFARKPLAEVDPHKWLLAIAEAEAPKIADLLPKGAAKYYLVTNIPGTAHAEAGSIDKMNRLLSKTIGIPAVCWWRDDINRRLDNAWSIKWVYPDLMTGPDFLRAVVESGLSEHKERRSNAIRAFLRSQYDVDEEVRFKQVELQNKLLDLFIDVPMALRDASSERKRVQQVYNLARLLYQQSSESDTEPSRSAGDDLEPRYLHPSDEPIGAATFLLSSIVQKNLPHVVLEGAPGQGKSTIAQYVCQVHRMKLLQRTELVKDIPSDHRAAPVRLPIKIDLRDFATWLNKKNPFTSEESEEPPANWHKSLEAFLAALISFQSGGTHFTTDDLLAIVRISALLLVFDGLDEVADVTKRREVVNEIATGTQRLHANAGSLQSVVTSRPAAFANSPGMPEGKYPHFQLLDLKPALILQYSERWIRARRLDSRMSGDFRRVLKTKLDQPHLRDLARNPMQLAILLSLILTRGASLPDKRTALYDYYIDLFFSRESEKSSVVRDHRDLLIDIHRYLAWLLHSEAEKGEARASISQERLQRVVSEYLEQEGHDQSLGLELFTGMVERVVALVSRVQGTFEFEVQPLREYFAACYLFYTAPQSSPGKERSGSRPDRFDVIAKNFYWLNVTRFYAGCYSKGELPSLVERLQELSTRPGYAQISYPLQLAATLLGDWVFTQNPRSIQQVVELIMGGSGLRFLLARAVAPRRRVNQGLLPELPPKCGRDELVTRCFGILATSPPNDFANQVLLLLRANSTTPSDLMPQWLSNVSNNMGSERLRWLKYGLQLGTLSTVDMDRLKPLLPKSCKSEILQLLYRARRLDFLQHKEAIFDAVIESILNHAIENQAQRRIESPFDALAQAIDVPRYAISFRDRQPVPLNALLERAARPAKLTWNPQLATATESYRNHGACMDLARVAEEESGKSAAQWATDLGPWNRIVETARKLFGDRWSFFLLANTAAGIKSKIEKSADCPELLDATRPLCGRARHARLRSNSGSWWKNQFKAAADKPLETQFVSLQALTWSTASCMLTNLDTLEHALSSLDEDQWLAVFHGARRATFWTSSKGEPARWQLNTKELPRQLSIRAACAIAVRCESPVSQAIYRKFLAPHVGENSLILGFALTEALDAQNYGFDAWKPDLE